MERVEGIEPSWPAWKAGTLPLSYTRINFLQISTSPRPGQPVMVVYLEASGCVWIPARSKASPNSFEARVFTTVR